MVRLSKLRNISKRFRSALIATAFVANQMVLPLSASNLFNSTVHADSPGNNGTLQVHEKGSADFKRSNEPHVCDFNFEAFGLDANQTGTVVITNQAPTQPKDAVALTLTNGLTPILTATATRPTSMMVVR